MAVTEAEVIAAAGTTSGTSASTASGSPGAGKLQLLLVGAVGGIPMTPAVSGCSLTWVQIISAEQGIQGLYLFRARGAAPTTGALTITSVQNGATWSWTEYDGIDTTGTNGSGAIVQSAKAVSTAVSSLTVTLAAFGAAGNATYGGFSWGVGVASGTPGSGFTEIHDADAGNVRIYSEWRNDNDTSVDMTTSVAVNNFLGIAVEINAGAASKLPLSVVKRVAVNRAATR